MCRKKWCGGRSTDEPGQVGWAEAASWLAGDASGGFLQKSSLMLRWELQAPQKEHSGLFKELPEFSLPVCGLPLSLFCFPFYSHLSLSVTDLKGSREKCKAANFTPSLFNLKVLLYFIFWALLLYSHFSSGRLDALENSPGFPLRFCKFLACHTLTLIWKALGCRLHWFILNIVDYFLMWIDLADWGSDPLGME